MLWIQDKRDALSFPVAKSEFVNIVLNLHTVQKLSEKGVEPRSFVITSNSLSISVRREVEEIRCNNVIGIDRNLRNITISTQSGPVMYKTGKLLSIKENTMHVIAAFKRNDRRTKNKFYSQKKNRRTRRVQQFLQRYQKTLLRERGNLIQ